MILGLELPSLNWSERLRLLGLASVSLLVSNLNILALKVDKYHTFVRRLGIVHIKKIIWRIQALCGRIISEGGRFQKSTSQTPANFCLTMLN